MNHVTRRRFLTLSGGAGLALAGCSAGEPTPIAPDFSALAPSGVDPTPDADSPVSTAGTVPASGRVLVVVQMGGGNDALNTLVPDDGRYHDARPTLALPDGDLLPLAGTDMRLHPSLAPLADHWDRGDLAALHTIGLPEQSRSHFVALDTWWAGSRASTSAGGWLGRWLDATASDDANPVRAVALGGGSPALVGHVSSPAVVQSPGALELQDRSGADLVTAAFEDMGGAGDGLLGQARAAIPTTLHTIDQLAGAIGTSGDVDGYSPASAVSLFDAAADIIQARLGTRVILINLTGYDTHANQLATHALLLGQLADGLARLFERLAESGDDDRVVALTYSEFGRRVAENGSAGTDHGQGGLAFLLGRAADGGRVVGEVDLGRLDNGDLRIDVDARSLYANALDWLGGPTDEVLGGSWDTYGLLSA